MSGRANFGTRLREVREHIGLTGQQFGEKIGLSKQQVSLLEKAERDLTAQHILLIYQAFHIDPRFFFGMLGTVADADLSESYEAPTTENLLKRLSDLEDKVRPAQDSDPVAHRVTVNAPLRDLVRRIMYLDATLLEKIDAFIQGFLISQSNSKKGSAARTSEARVAEDTQDAAEPESMAGHRTESNLGNDDDSDSSQSHDPVYDTPMSIRPIPRLQEVSRNEGHGSQPKVRATLEFRQSSIFAWVVSELYDEGRPVSRFRVGKMIYLIERSQHLGTFQGFIKQAAGPYDPSLRYGGPEKIAIHDHQWLLETDDSHFAPGPNILNALRYAERYFNIDEARVVIQDFRTYRDGALERWTTLDMAIREIHDNGGEIGEQAILDHIRGIPEWAPKLDRDEFSISKIRKTLIGLRKRGYISENK